VALAVGPSLVDECLAGSDAAVLDEGDGVDGSVEQPVSAGVDSVPGDFARQAGMGAVPLAEA
jgi:hypothetical protein